MRLAEALWTRTGPPPSEFLRYRLRTMYHLTPRQLQEEARGHDLMEMLRDLRCASMESRAARGYADLR